MLKHKSIFWILPIFFYMFSLPSILAVNIIIDSPENTTTLNIIPNLSFSTSELSNVTYSWDDNINITGCVDCSIFNNTYGEYDNNSDNLTLLLHFNENSSIISYDDSGRNNNAELKNGLIFADSKFGSGLKFDGVDDYLEIPSNISLNLREFNNPHTVNLWFRIYKLPSEAGFNFALVSQANGGGTGGSWIMVPSGGGSGYAANEIIGVGSSAVGVGSNVIAEINKWYFVSFVYNGSHMFIYVNGSVGDNKINSINASATGSILLGTNKGITNAFFNGTIDDLAFFKRQLSVEEINEIFNKSLSNGVHNITVFSNISNIITYNTTYFTIGTSTTTTTTVPTASTSVISFGPTINFFIKLILFLIVVYFLIEKIKTNKYILGAIVLGILGFIIDSEIFKPENSSNGDNILILMILLVSLLVVLKNRRKR